MNYKYNETAYAELIFHHGFQSPNHMPTELRLLAVYMRRNLDYKPKKLKEELDRWCGNHIENYHKASYYQLINRAVSQAVKKGSVLIQVDKISIDAAELDFIQSLPIQNEDGQEYEHSYLCKKLMFTLLVQLKINKAVAEARNADADYASPRAPRNAGPSDRRTSSVKVYPGAPRNSGPSGRRTSSVKVYNSIFFKGGQSKYAALKKMAKLPDKIRINEDLIHHLYLSGHVTPMYGGMIRLDFMADLYKKEASGTEAIVLTDFDRTGWYYDSYYKKNQVILCRYCGLPFKKKSNRQEYCLPDCAAAAKKQKKDLWEQSHRRRNEN